MYKNNNLQKNIKMLKDITSSPLVSSTFSVYSAYLSLAYDSKKDEIEKLLKENNEVSNTFVITSGENPICQGDTQFYKIYDSTIIIETEFHDADGVQADAFERDDIKRALLKINDGVVSFKLYDSSSIEKYHEKIEDLAYGSDKPNYKVTIKDPSCQEPEYPPPQG